MNMKTGINKEGRPIMAKTKERKRKEEGKTEDRTDTRIQYLPWTGLS